MSNPFDFEEFIGGEEKEEEQEKKEDMRGKTARVLKLTQVQCTMLLLWMATMVGAGVQRDRDGVFEAFVSRLESMGIDVGSATEDNLTQQYKRRWRQAVEVHEYLNENSLKLKKISSIL